MEIELNYIDFSVEDFVWDPAFRRWALNPDNKPDLFWNQWILANPQKAATVLTAKQIIRAIKVKHSPISENEIALSVQSIMKQIDTVSVPEISKDKESSFSIKYYAVVASVLSTIIGLIAMQNIAVAQTVDFNKKPNIIWIITEDISPELGCYGYGLVQTPNLDRLAEQGVKYTQAFSTAPVCSASRSAIITGMYQTSIDAQNHRSHRDDGYMLPAPVKPITEYLKAAGYYTVLAEVKENGLKGYGKTDYNFQLPTPAFEDNDWKNRKPGQPFFAELMVSVTHRGPIWKGAVQQHQPQIDPDKVVLPPYYPNHPVAREDWATYLESIQLLDAYVGNILKRIDDEGLSKNTVIIFTSDHGRCMVRDKQFIYDGGIHIPFIMSWPGQLKAGKVNSNLVSAIDISATVLQLAGLTPPAYMEGRVLLGNKAVKRDYIVAARDRMDETVDKMRCIRTKRFKYIKNYYPERPYMQPNEYKETEYPVWNLMKELAAQNKLTPAQAKFTALTKPEEELYDIVKDPNELNNLYQDPKYQKQLLAMRKTLSNWIATTGDKGQYPEKKIWLPKKQGNN